MNHFVLISACTIVSVLLIITDWRHPFETRIESRYGVTRVAYVPILMILVLLITSAIDLLTLITVSVEKFDIVALVLSFAVVSEGMRSSGMFQYAVSQIIEFCSDTRQLVLYSLIGTALLTVFTSNDIVIIGTTPIIYGICVQSNIDSCRRFLLSHFVVANSASIATYIGSPTNIILSQEFGIHFIQYLSIMLGPSTVVFTSCILITYLYTMKDESNDPLREDIESNRFTTDMRNWILLFGSGVLIVTTVTFYSLSLLYCAVPLSSFSIYLMSRNNYNLRTLYDIPYDLMFFALAFFTIGDSIVGTQAIQDTVIPSAESFISSNPVLSTPISIFGVGFVVNIVNDLPAAAIISPILEAIDTSDPPKKLILIQSTLVGLNIGKYLTQVGSLAGIMWFKILKEEDSRSDRQIQIPSLRSLIVFGSVNFVLTAILCSLYIAIEYHIMS